MKYYVNKNLNHNGKSINGGEIFDPSDVGFDDNDIKFLINQFRIRPFIDSTIVNEKVETIITNTEIISDNKEEEKEEIEEYEDIELVKLEDPIDFDKCAEENFNDTIEQSNAGENEPTIEVKTRKTRTKKVKN